MVETIIEGIALVNYFALLVAFCMSLYVAVSFGRGVLNVFFVSVCAAAFFLGAYFFFAWLEDSEIYMLSDMTFHLWAHLIVYSFLGSIIWGGYHLRQAVDTGKGVGLSLKDFFFYGGLGVLLAGIFFLSPLLDATLSPLPIVMIVHMIGLHHFIAVMMAAFSFWYLRYVRGNWGLLSESMSMLMAVMILIGCQHLWENLTESWKVIHVTTVVGEGVEKLILFPAMLLLVYAQYEVVRFIRRTH